MVVAKPWIFIVAMAVGICGCGGVSPDTAEGSLVSTPPQSTHPRSVPTSDCICTEIYDPVCCGNAGEFGNLCKAICSGHHSTIAPCTKKPEGEHCHYFY